MRKPVTIIVSAGLVLTGCSDDAGEDGLLGALGKVAATADTRTDVEYGQPARVKALLDEDKARYQALQGYGYSGIGNYGELVEDALPLDLDGFDEAVYVGKPPKQGGVLWGEYDVAGVDGKLGEAGADSEKGLGNTRWRAADDYELNFESTVVPNTPGMGDLNVVRTAAGSFAYAPAAEGIGWVTEPGDTTLADDDVIGPLARCLGDVIAARLVATGTAVGVRADGTEVICVDGDEERVSEALSGQVPSSREPWADALPGAEVDEDVELVRVTVPAAAEGRPVGRVLRMMATRDLEAFQ